MGNGNEIEVSEVDTERAATDDEVSVYRWRLEGVYRAHNAGKLQNVPNLLRKHRHRLRLLHALYLRVCEKYRVTPEAVFVSKHCDIDDAGDVALDVGALRLQSQSRTEIDEEEEDLEYDERKGNDENVEIEEKVVYATAYASLFGSH